MASLPPFAAAARRTLIHSQRPTILGPRSPWLLLIQPQTRSITLEERHKKSVDRMMSRMENQRGHAQPSMRTNQSEAMMEELAEILLPSTFVTPPFFSRPSILTDTRNRIKFEWVRTKIKVQDFVSRYLSRLWHRDPFFRRDIIPSAEALHRNMYTAYARGDVDTLQKICSRDLYQTFRNRIVSRPPNVQFSWKFSGYNSKSRVMSHKVGMLGKGKGDENSVRQVVVKIDSTQSLTKGIDGKVVKGTGEPTRTTEFLVLTKRRKEGQPEGPWLVWGTVTESGMDDVESFGLPPTAGSDATVQGGGGRWS